MRLINFLKSDIKALADPERAKKSQRYFKTGKGEYGEGDVFIGLTVPQSRSLAKKYKGLLTSELTTLLRSPIHEERLIAILILVHNFETGSDGKRSRVYEFYLQNIRYVNNWDLVDLSAHKIVGAYLFDKPKDILYVLSQSDNLWGRRIAIISTFWFIKQDEFYDAVKIGELLLFDKHDLIHKAVGWMLREVGKRSLKTEETFLKKYAKTMPRTTLRYAIEKFPETKRKHYMKR